MESVLSGREVPESSKLQEVSNYTLWAFKTTNSLYSEKLWRLVDPTLSPPRAADASDTGESSEITPPTSKHQQLQLKEARQLKLK